jgi:hypothetical protein
MSDFLDDKKDGFLKMAWDRCSNLRWYWKLALLVIATPVLIIFFWKEINEFCGNAKEAKNTLLDSNIVSKVSPESKTNFVVITGKISDGLNQPIDSAEVKITGWNDTVFLTKKGTCDFKMPFSADSTVCYEISKTGFKNWTGRFNISDAKFFAKLTKIE